MDNLVLKTTTLLLFIISTTSSLHSSIAIDLTQCVTQVDPRFLSVALDSHIVAEGWKNFDFKSPRVLNMARALSPAYLRLGGTAADLLFFKAGVNILNNF